MNEKQPNIARVIGQCLIIIFWIYLEETLREALGEELRENGYFNVFQKYTKSR